MAVNERGFSLIEMLVTMVVTIVALGIALQIFVQGNRAYARQRDYDDARSNAAAALDMTVRLLRSATVITPDPDGNLVADSVRIRSDWNPRDGDENDPYENVLFTTNNGTLFKREPTDAAPVAFAERIASMTFTYWTPAGAPIATPWTVSQNQLGLVRVNITSTTVGGVTLAMTSSASIRRTE